MSAKIIARRYARAFAKLTGLDPQKEKERLESLQGVKELFAQAGAAKILKSPVMPMDLKHSLLSYGLRQGQADALSTQFIFSVAEQGRVALIPEILEAYGQMLDEASGTSKATVTTAVSLGSQELEALNRELEALFGRKVELQPQVDPEILGGFIVQLNHSLIDMSLKSKVQALTANCAAH